MACLYRGFESRPLRYISNDNANVQTLPVVIEADQPVKNMLEDIIEDYPKSGVAQL